MSAKGVSVSHKIFRRPLPDSWAATFTGMPSVLARLYASRGVETAAELERGLDRLHPVSTMKGIDAAAALLADAVQQGRRILVVGDFDCDGATSTAVALRALRLMGAREVQFLVPNRFEYGYGLTPEIVAVAAKMTPDLIVTVDNGIASIDGVAAAKQLGIQVLVTDHHLPGATLPLADAIVNPNQPGCEFPSKMLAGVGVIFYVMMALRGVLRDAGWFERRAVPLPNLAQLLDLVALGTVADVVPLDQANRILVAQGLARIRAGQCCAGITALLEVAGRSRGRAVASDLGFVVGPRLNAAGRLEDMAIGIHCLLTDDPTQAQQLAKTLDGLNRERRSIETEMQDQALAHLESMQLGDAEALPTGLCIFQPDWHQGVIGILASRIKDRYHRPVIAFAEADAATLKGSARSVPGFHIRDALDAVATRHPGLIQKFGGHAMAAGLSLDKNRFEAFVVAFDAEARRHLGSDDLHGRLWSDGELTPADFTLELAETLRQGGPWGQGFPEPLFDGTFEIVNRRIVGERHLKLILKPVGSDVSIGAIAFNTDDHDWPSAVRQVHAAYKLDVNEFRGACDVQLLIDYIEPL